jgi:hypothetical protein
MIEWNTCDHCKQRGELGKDMRAHAIDVPGKEKRVVRLLHVGSCSSEWFARYSAWSQSEKVANG